MAASLLGHPVLPQMYLREQLQQSRGHSYGVRLPTKALEAAEHLYQVLGVLALGWTWIGNSCELLTLAVLDPASQKVLPLLSSEICSKLPSSCTPTIAPMMWKLAGIY